MLRLGVKSAVFRPGVQKGISSVFVSSKRWSANVSSQNTAPTLPEVSKDSPLLTATGHLTVPQRFVRSLPNSWIPYAELMRLDKPVGTWLLYTPCTWAILMAAYASSAPVSHTVTTLALFGVGSIVMRGAGCTINDILDRDLDNKVGRTITRPLARRAVTVPQAVGFLGAQCMVGLGVLLSLPYDCFYLGAASLPLVFSYPLFKRFTYYPQVVLSACFTWGALLGFPAMGVWDIPTMLSLYGSAFAWCMTYDTIYAHQDKLFDIEAGIRSTALKWGEQTKKVLYGLTAVQIGLLGAAGVTGGMGGFFFAGVGICAYRVLSMIKKVNLDSPEDCWKWFLSNINTGHYVAAGAALDYLSKLYDFAFFWS